ncbi:MAG: hypothetical protein J6125_03450 [Clostridia bacterium]|nr:hypothetical protein [Clostridia bacterium]
MATSDLNPPIGWMTVRTLTAGGALPLAGVNVTVTGNDPGNREVVFDTLTDASGKTERLPLPVPEAELSETPGNPAPYATYNVLVQTPGYYMHESRAVPVFEGITSIQTVEMIPRSFAGDRTAAPALPAEDPDRFFGGSGQL